MRWCDDGGDRRIQRCELNFSKILSPQPSALAEMLLAVDFFLDKPNQIVIMTPEGKINQASPFLSLFRKEFLPNRILIVTSEIRVISKSCKSRFRQWMIAKAPLFHKRLFTHRFQKFITRLFKLFFRMFHVSCRFAGLDRLCKKCYVANN